MVNPVRLMDYVNALQNNNRRDRLKILIDALEALDIRPVIQESRRLGLVNLIVDFSERSGDKPVIYSAHYDSVRDRPGANDNASGVAVLLGLCREIRQFALPVRIVFFDREEAWLRTPLLKLGLLGSLYYAFKADLRNIKAVCNLEFCGNGDFLAIWPVKTRERGLPLLQEIRKAACEIDLLFKSVHVPWPYMSSDHLSFRLMGFKNALTLSLIPNHQVPVLEKMVQNIGLKGYFPRRQAMPEPLSVIHSRYDTSDRLSEESMQLMLALLLQMIRNNSHGKFPGPTRRHIVHQADQVSGRSADYV